MKGQSAPNDVGTFRPDLIVLDIVLSGMDGMEALSRLLQESEVYVLIPVAKTEEMNKLLWLADHLQELPTTAIPELSVYHR